MKENFVHVCFVIDESGSMGCSTEDVIGGFKSMVDKQREIKDGTCAVSLFKFATEVSEVYRGVDVNKVDYLDRRTYFPSGMTAMNDGIGIAIDTIGKWIAGMEESERPEKNIIVIMTDGEENYSKEYTTAKIQEMIKHQEEKYSWSFVYMGTDVTNIKAAKDLGIRSASYTTRSNHVANYATINSVLTTYRCSEGDAETKSYLADACLCSSVAALNSDYEAATGIKVDSDDNSNINVKNS